MQNKLKSLLKICMLSALFNTVAIGEEITNPTPDYTLPPIPEYDLVLPKPTVTIDIPTITFSADDVPLDITPPKFPSKTQLRMHVYDHDPAENWNALFQAEKQRTENIDTADAQTRTSSFADYWRDALQRHDTLMADPAYHTHKKKWENFLEKQRTKSAQDQIENVNTFFNQYTPDSRYRNGKSVPSYMISGLDERLYGGEYFASPLETIKNKAADCDDYVVAKYLSLKSLGFHDDDLRFAIVRNDSPAEKGEDTNTRPLHAVLFVNTADGVHVLNNNAPYLSKAEDNTTYTLLHTMNTHSLSTYAVPQHPAPQPPQRNI